MKRFRLEHIILLGLCGFLLAIALTVDYHRVVDYMFSDEAVYYMMAQSVAYDQDLEYTWKDLRRVYRDGWHAGPLGVFLTKTENGKIFYSKSFAYAIFLAPFIAMFGFNGFLILNMLLLLGMIWMGWAYLRQFNPPPLSLLVSLTFFLLSASFVYTFWITPETFNMFCIMLGLFLWLYKWKKHLIYLAPIPIGIACASKLPNALFILPIVADLLLEGYTLIFRGERTSSFGSSRLPFHWRSRPLWQWVVTLVLVCGIFWVTVGVFYGLQYTFTGHLNPYAGDRKTFYTTFPEIEPRDVWDRGVRLSNDDYMEQSFFFHPKTLLYNVYYYVFGRFTGILPYFFCAVLAVYYFVRGIFFKSSTFSSSASPSRHSIATTREFWRRVFLLLTIVASILTYIVMAPGNYQGGGGAFGNRFFLNIYPAFLFLIITISSIRPLVLSWIVGSLFLAQALINPFQTSYSPASHAFRYPYRFFPVELTLVETLPTNVNQHLMQMMHEEEPPFRLYFVDEYASDISAYGFTVQGKRTTEMILRAYEPQESLVITMTNGPIRNQVDVTVAGITQSVRFNAPRETRHLVFPLREAMPYFKTHLYPVRIQSHTGYVPLFKAGETGLGDHRYLGCRVNISLNPFKIGKAYFENGHPDEALTMLETAVKNHPDDLQARYYRVMAYRETGMIEEALRELEQLEGLLPSFQERMIQRCESQGEECISERLSFKSEHHTKENLAHFLHPLTRSYEAEHSPRTTGNVVEQQEASNGKAVIFDPTVNPPGFPVYGQNAVYLPGQYQARFRMRVPERRDGNSPSLGTALFFEVFDRKFGILNRQRVVFEAGQHARSSAFKDYTLNFDLAQPSTLEFRVQTTGEAHVEIDKIDLYSRLPLQIYRALAEVHMQNGAYEEALKYLQQLVVVDSWTPQIQGDLLKTLVRLEDWENVSNMLHSSHTISPTRTGIASALAGEEIAAPHIRQFLKELNDHFSPAIPLEYTFADSIALIGYDLSAETVVAGETFSIQYFWKALRMIIADYAIFVHVIPKGESGESAILSKITQKLGLQTAMFQQDHQPLQGKYPTSSWIPGEIIREQYDVNVPEHLKAGTYEIWVGLWNSLTKQRLPSGENTKVKIGEIHIQ